MLKVKMSRKENEDKKDEAPTKDSMELLEEALTICGFGRFHTLLLAATMCTAFSTMIVTTTSSYILPIAECDLDMNIMQKGVLNAIIFFGQVGASLFTGFLIDIFGRRIFLIGGNYGLFVLTILEGSSQNYWMIVFIKFFQGIPLSLCWSALTPMLTEFIEKKLRNKVLLLNAIFISLSFIVTGLLSWVVLPLQIHVVIWKGYFELHAWNIYLYVCSIWSLLGALLYHFIPESPKYLLSHGMDTDALETLKIVYRQNTGKPNDEFPIKSLNQVQDFEQSVDRTFKEQLTHSSQDVKELFRQPLLMRIILFTFISFISLSNYSSLRLWFPQITTIVENYQVEHNGSAEFCVMIDSYKTNLHNVAELSNITEPVVCIAKVSGSETYISGTLLGVFYLVFVCLSACVIDFVGQNILMTITLLMCCVCSSSVYWANTSTQIALLISITCALMQTFLSLLQNLLVRVFPTTVRALAMSLILLIGRVGSLIGSIIFPILLEAGCMAPFISLSSTCLCVTCLIYFLPNPNKEKSGGGDN